MRNNYPRRPPSRRAPKAELANEAQPVEVELENTEGTTTANTVAASPNTAAAPPSEGN